MAAWTPMLDEDGEQIPIVYTFSATDEEEKPVGRDIDCTEMKPASLDMLHEEAVRHAQAIAAANSDKRPWRGWVVSIAATGLHVEPDQITMFTFQDLLLPSRDR